jgi:hypothetical protein
MRAFGRTAAVGGLLWLLAIPAMAAITVPAFVEYCQAQYPPNSPERFRCLQEYCLKQYQQGGPERLECRQVLQQRGPSRILVDPRQDLDALQKAPLEIHIPDAAYRVAVFTFEDPDKTGLGNALASLVSREVLLRSSVGSIGVLRYEGSLASSPSEPLSYFDKVSLLTDAQRVTVAIWGMVRRAGDKVSIDTFVQLPSTTLDSRFRWSLQLPKAMGGKALVARASPSRLLVQRHEMSLAAADDMAARMKDRDNLRKSPEDRAPLVATLPAGEVYWVAGKEGDWVRLTTKATSGWVRASGHCTQACAALLDTPGFIVDLLSFMSKRIVPKERGRLSIDARAFGAQLALFERYGVARPASFDPNAFEFLARWRKRDGGFSSTSPSGAAFANAYTLAKISEALKSAASRLQQQRTSFEEIRLSTSSVEELAFDLAKASVDDPHNKDVLTNLSILFEYANDGERAALAARLAAEAR